MVMYSEPLPITHQYEHKHALYAATAGKDTLKLQRVLTMLRRRVMSCHCVQARRGKTVILCNCFAMSLLSHLFNG